jgi:hypothetical protein
MMKSLRAAVAAFVMALVPGVAGAVTVTTDFTDMWWNPNESGWGANVIQQGEILFVTLFVYDSSNQPIWYVAPDTGYVGSQGGGQRFTGRLYRVTGPYFGAASFNPNTVNAVDVGTLTMTFPFVASGTLQYSVNGVNVTKSVQRQTWRTESLAGSYRGATTGVFTGCSSNGNSDEAATFTITQVGSQVTINEFGNGYSCRYTGTYTQTGKMGTISGTGTCNDGAIQSFTASEVQVGLDFIAMALVTDLGSCHFAGRLGGMRRP